MGFQDVVFLPVPVSYYTTFLKKSGRGESPRITTCLRTVFESKQEHANCKIHLLHQCLFV